MGFDQATVLVRHGVAVEIKVHRALLRQDALGVEGIKDLARGRGSLASASALTRFIVERDGAASCQGGSQSGDG
ncbi:hypothetical protein D3C75_1087530 [compost metagenome]